MESRLVSRNLDRLNGIAVVYTDMDGTMLGPRGSFLHAPDGSLSREPTDALIAAHAAEVDVAPVSGRALRGLQTDARLLAMGTCIAEMGALLSYDFGLDIVQNFGATPQPGMPAAIMEECGAVAALLQKFDGRIEHHMPWAKWRECTHLFRGHVNVDEVNAFLIDQGFGWLQLFDNGRLHGEYLGIRKGDARAYHLQPRGVSKGSAVALDRERRGFAREETIAIGDAFADLELTAEVGTMIIVGDAVAADPILREAVMALDDVLITDRPQNLGWTDVVQEVSARA